MKIPKLWGVCWFNWLVALAAVAGVITLAVETFL